MSKPRTLKPGAAKLDAIHAASDGPSLPRQTSMPLADEARTAFEPTTCATDHLACERVLRLLENPMIERLPDQEGIDMLYRLASNAGPKFNRASLARTGRNIDEVPF